MECMGKDCDILVPEDFVLNIVKDSKQRDKYMNNTFSDYVNVSVYQQYSNNYCSYDHSLSP